MERLGSTTHIGTARMRISLATSLLLLLLLFQVNATGLSNAAAERQLLKKGDRVDFASHLNTAGRRLAPSSQLIMSPGSLHKIHKATCVCEHELGKRWSCVADLPKKYKLGSIEVNCEGFDWREDPYILKGSCLLRYSIVKRLTFIEGCTQLLGVMIVLYLAPWWVQALLGLLWILGRSQRFGARRGKYRARGLGKGTRR